MTYLPDPAAADERQARARILIVDDELWGMLLRMLLEAGYQHAEAVSSAREAFRAVIARPVDLAVLDVTLQGDDVVRDGCDLGRKLCRQWPGTRVLFLTGWGPGSLPEDCPPDLPLVTKPVTPQAFKARVAEALLQPPYVWRD